MRKILALFFILLLLAPYAAADGMIFIEDRDMWSLQPEQNQAAAIHYEDGMENLLISVSPGSDFKGDKAVWIFPVPAAPGSVKIDVLKGYPRLTGSRFEDDFTQTVTMATAASVMYATFPVCIISGGATVILSAYVFGMAGSLSKSSDIEIFDRVEKMGVVTEVVSAHDAGALNNFLILRGMTPTGDGQEMLRSYIAQNYTFVVTSISDVKAFRNASSADARYYDPYSGLVQENMIGVFVRFPADRIYYPLKPTAVYGSREVPVLLYVTGWVRPKLYDSIRDRTEVTYFTQGHYSPPEALVPFFNGKASVNNLKYTKLKINAASNRFSEDLWIDPLPPADMVAREAYLNYAFLFTAAAYVLFSAVASLLAGMLVFRKKTCGAKHLLLHGLWNCFTFIGLAIATKKKFPQEEYGKRGPFILAFYIIFGILLSVYTVVLAPSLAVAVLLGWGAALLSPLLSLGLLFMIPMMAGIVSVFIIGLALCPVPALLWLKRWIDPEVAEQPGME